MTINREDNKYSETIKGAKTGEIISTCNEPLDKHIVHGSAKFKKKPNNLRNSNAEKPISLKPLKFGEAVSGLLKVRPKEKDKSDRVVQVSIETKDFEKYIVAENNMGRELFDYIDEMVTVRGYIVGEYFDGSEIFFVESYEIL